MNYGSRVPNIGYFQVRHNSRVVIYDRRAFIRLTTGLQQIEPELFINVNIGPFYADYR